MANQMRTERVKISSLPGDLPVLNRVLGQIYSDLQRLDDAKLESADFDNQLPTYQKGDLLVIRTNAQMDRLPLGSDGQVLTADSTQLSGIKWATVASVIKSVQYGTISITSTNTSNTATITSVDTTKTALIFLGSAQSLTANSAQDAYITLTNATTVTATRLGSTSGTTTVSFCVLEYN